jgi:nucleoside-diphosphate-sugar epimerase
LSEGHAIDIETRPDDSHAVASVQKEKFMADTTERVVILGGHGKVALLAAPTFESAGIAVDSVIRNPDHSAEVTAAGGNPVVLDIENATVDELADAFSGAKAVVFSAGAAGSGADRTLAVDYRAAVRSMEAAARAGVSRFVMVSYATAATDVDTLDPSDSFYPYAKAKHDADEHLRGTELDFTILGPGLLTLEPTDGRIQLADIEGRELPADDKVTSRQNVADVMVHVIVSGAASRQTINFYDGETPIAEAIR